MSIRVTQEFISRGNSILNELWDEVTASKQPLECCISDCIINVLNYDKAKTYKYILLTQLLGKAVDERVNILAMKTSSNLEGAWDARNLCEGVVTKGGFEKNVLHGILGRSKQPYNSSPGQKPELSKQNHTRPSDVALRDELIDALELVTTSAQAKDCLRCFLCECERQILILETEGPFPELLEGSSNCARVGALLASIANQGRDGEGLSLATAMLLKITLDKYLGFETHLHKVNASRKGHGDLDLTWCEQRFATFELKDKPFTAQEVKEYAKSALEEGCPRFAFVYGRNAGGLPGAVFDGSDLTDMAKRGQIACCIPFDSLRDSLLLFAHDVQLEELRTSMNQFIDDALIKPETANIARRLFRELATEDF